jgi:hypothetical protein
MSSAPFQSLQAVNHSLRARLSRLPGGHNHSVAIAPTELTDLLAELLQATDCLRSLSMDAGHDADTASEISEYRNHVEQLGKILPAVQGRLLIEKARLETARTHTAKAAAWAQGSKKTL